MKQKHWLILDIDGVMVAYPDGPDVQPQYFTPSAVEALKYLIEELIANRILISICLSSSMRLYPAQRAKLQRMFGSAGIPWHLIRDYTPWSGSMAGNSRKREIAEWRAKMDDDDHCIAVDDEILFDFPYIKVDPRVGFTKEQADQIVHLFAKTADVDPNYQFHKFGFSWIKEEVDL